MFPVEPLQETNPEQDQDPFMTSPNKSPKNQRNGQGHNHSGHRGRCRVRGHGKGRGSSHGPKKFFCHFHGNELDHTTNFCPKKKKP